MLSGPTSSFENYITPFMLALKYKIMSHFIINKSPLFTKAELYMELYCQMTSDD